MEYVEKLLQKTEFLQMLGKLEQLEEHREFCRHGLSHLLDTARIAWIRVLEGGVSLEKEMIYLAALLHDLGRIQEYEAGIPHHQAGKLMAEKLLIEIAYPKEKQAIIVKAIEGHRKQCLSGEWEELGSLLHWADKKSRNCFFCKAQAECKWEPGKRNTGLMF